MNRKQKVAIVVGALVITALTSCGERTTCPDCARVQQALAEAQRTIADLQAEREAARPALVRGGDGRLFTGDDAPLEQPAHYGQILDVDTGANVAIISLGSDDGVRLGFRYTVSRGSQYVTMIEITDLQAKKSAGRSMKGYRKTDIKVGDRVQSR